MAVVQMSKLAICAVKQQRKAILEALQNMGAMEVVAIEDAEGTEKMDTLQSRMVFEKNAQLAANAAEILNRYLPDKGGLLASLNGKELRTTKDARRMAAERDGILRIAGEIVALDKQIAEDKAGIQKAEAKIESLEPWKALDVGVYHTGTATTGTIIGTIPGTREVADIAALIAEKAPELETCDVTIVAHGDDQTYIAVLCFKEDLDRVEGILRENGFSRPAQGGVDAPMVRIERNRKRIEHYRADMEETERKIKALGVHRDDLRMCSDYYTIRSRKYEILGMLPQTENTFFVEGYVPTKVVPRMKQKLEDECGAFVEMEEIGEDEEVPVLLDNNKFSANAEGVLESFGLPGKGEMDPTFWMSIFYVILFGLMLSDAAYGLVVSVACGLLLKKCPRMEKGMRRLIGLFFWCGLSTIFWGVLFGGYFGDVIPVIARTFFHKEVNIAPLWFAPLDNPMKMLIWSLIFGVIHLFFGLGLKGYSLAKKKDWTAVIFDVGCWFMMLIGLILMLIPTSIFAGIAGQQFVFPDWLNVLAKVLAVAGALGILLMSARDNKNFGLRLALGAYDLYGVTGWLSDVLSYSRLLALGLATGVMASVFNQMGSMLGGSVIGAILFILVFFVGHIFNLAINLLGAYVHTSRLQYVEFFGKFYDGGGKPFEPFDNQAKYVQFKEET